MPKILVLYYSRTGNTEKMAKTESKVQVDLNYFVEAEDLTGFDALVVGTPTYHHDLPIDIKMLFEEAAARNFNLKGKPGAAFGSCGWSGEAPGFVLEIMRKKFEMNVTEAPLLGKYAPDQKTLEQCSGLGKRLAENFMRQS